MNQQLNDIPVWGHIISIPIIVCSGFALSSIGYIIYDSSIIAMLFLLLGWAIGIGSSYGVVRTIQVFLQEEKEALRKERLEKKK